MSKEIAKQKANKLVDRFRVILMDEDTECGNEILCTLIAIEHAKIVCEEVIWQWDNTVSSADIKDETIFNTSLNFWIDVTQELEKM